MRILTITIFISFSCGQVSRQPTLMSEVLCERIYAEAEFSKTMPKYFDQPIAEQIESYRAEGYPARMGLIATGLIARSTAADLSAIEEMWWDENLRWSYQDQLSLPVVLWRWQ